MKECHLSQGISAFRNMLDHKILVISASNMAEQPEAQRIAQSAHN